jgi:hypothetical protein
LKIASPKPHKRPTPPRSPLPREVSAWKSEKAREIVSETVDPCGTLVEENLVEARGLTGAIDDTLALTLRHHPRWKFKRLDGDYGIAPAMIAAYQALGVR